MSPGGSRQLAQGVLDARTLPPGRLGNGRLAVLTDILDDLGAGANRWPTCRIERGSFHGMLGSQGGSGTLARRVGTPCCSSRSPASSCTSTSSRPAVASLSVR